MSITHLTAEQLHRAARIREQIDKLESEFAALLAIAGDALVTVRGRGRPAKSVVTPKQPASTPKRRMSKAGRARIAAAAKARWAKFRAAGKVGAPTPTAPKRERKISAAARAKMAIAAKARWAKVKAAGKKRL
jgi:hypothetical protein